MNGPTNGNGFRPGPRDVEDLIRRAEDHPLGAEFLRQGALDAVAATFQVHAFVVDAARRTLDQPDREASAGAPALVSRGSSRRP